LASHLTNPILRFSRAPIYRFDDGGSVGGHNGLLEFTQSLLKKNLNYCLSEGDFMGYAHHHE
jgi:hypothetical protein